MNCESSQERIERLEREYWRDKSFTEKMEVVELLKIYYCLEHGIPESEWRVDRSIERMTKRRPIEPSD